MSKKLDDTTIIISVQNLENFCQDAESISVLAIQNLCCDLVQGMVGDACFYTDCTSNTLLSYEQSTLNILSAWIDSCVCSVDIPDTCDVQKALGNDIIVQLQNQFDLPQVNLTDVSPVMGEIANLLVDMQTPDEEKQKLQVFGFAIFSQMGLDQQLTSFEFLAVLPKFKKFNDYMQQQNLQERIRGYPVTIFSFNESLVNEMEKQIPDQLSSEWNRTLLNHITFGPITNTELATRNERDLQTLSGSFIKVKSVASDQLQLQGCCFPQNMANQVATTKTKDGAVWIIDSVIYPPGIAKKVYG